MKTEVRINSEGRVVIPAKVRRDLNIKNGDMLALEMNDGTIIITPAAARCMVCQSTNDLIEANDIILCKACAKTIRYSKPFTV